MKKILVVDDDPHIREVVLFTLEKADMKGIEASDGAQALQQYRIHNPDLMILDINMPEMDGLEVCRELRKTSDVPILFLSSRDDEIDKVLGLELGADDYLTKPFSPREMIARVKAVLKRAAPRSGQTSVACVYQLGKIRLDAEGHQVLWDGKQIDLTATEFLILKGMIKQPERVFDRDNIMNFAYDVNIHVSDRTIDSHIRNIRQKFAEKGCESFIQTIRGVGYKLAVT